MSRKGAWVVGTTFHQPHFSTDVFQAHIGAVSIKMPHYPLVLQRVHLGMTQVRYVRLLRRQNARCAKVLSVLSPFTPFNAAPPRICMICGCCRARYSMTRGLRRRQPVGSSAADTLAAHTPAKRRRGRSREDRLGRKSPLYNWAISINDVNQL